MQFLGKVQCARGILDMVFLTEFLFCVVCVFTEAVMGNLLLILYLHKMCYNDVANISYEALKLAEVVVK